MTNAHKQLVIAVDGTSASGKSTLSEKLAEEYGARRLEYSLFFRLIALHMLQQGFVPNAAPTDAQVAQAAHYAKNLTWETIQQLKDDPELRSIDVSRTAPFFSGLPEILTSTDTTIRTLVDACRDTPVIVEGRTIGKYVYPDADVKLFVDADIELRGARRGATLRQKGKNVSNEEAAADLAERDRQDQSRAFQPTGFDASVHTYINTTAQEIGETLAIAKGLIDATMNMLESSTVTPSATRQGNRRG